MKLQEPYDILVMRKNEDTGDVFSAQLTLGNLS